MNNTKTISAVPQSGTDNIINKNILAWQEARREQARRRRVASAARSFRENFGRPQFALPKGFALAC